MTNGRSAQRSKRKSAYKKGHWAEFFAAVYLVFKGYRILALRYKTKSGEVDIIAKKADLIAFVEVKARHSEQAATDSVSRTAMQRIHAASEFWLAKEAGSTNYSLRYDIIAVTPWRLPTHYIDAF